MALFCQFSCRMSNGNFKIAAMFDLTKSIKPHIMKRMIISLSYGLTYLAMIGFYSYLRLNESRENSKDSQCHRSQLKKVHPKIR